MLNQFNSECMLTIVDALDFSVAARTKRPACFGVATACETPLKRNVIRQIQQYALDLKVTRTLPDVLESLCICASCAKNSSLVRRMPESGTKAITTLLRLRRFSQTTPASVKSTAHRTCYVHTSFVQDLSGGFPCVQEFRRTSLSLISRGAAAAAGGLGWPVILSMHCASRYE